jgi:hypothetical protein
VFIAADFCVCVCACVRVRARLCVWQCMIFKHIRVMCQTVMVIYLHVNMASMHHVTRVTWLLPVPFYSFGRKVFICLHSWSGIVLCFKRFTVSVYFCTSVFIYMYFVGFLLISCTFYVRHLSFNKTADFAPCVLKLCTWFDVFLTVHHSIDLFQLPT